MAASLNNYITLVRRLLHDPQGQMWSDQELTDDINQARSRIAADSKCLRQLITAVTLTANQELYTIVTTANTGTPANLGLQIVEVMGITIYWGNQRIKLQNRPFSEQDAKLRIWQSYVTRPGSIARMGSNLLYINPTPDQGYTSDWDCVIVPTPLALNTDPEVLAVPFQTPVPFYAAHIAKFNAQDYGESDKFYQKYLVERAAAMWAARSTIVRDAYRR